MSYLTLFSLLALTLLTGFFAGYLYAAHRWASRLVTTRDRSHALLECLLTTRSKLMGMAEAIDRGPSLVSRGALRRALDEIATAAGSYVIRRDETGLRAPLGADAQMARHFEEKYLARAPSPKPQPDGELGEPSGNGRLTEGSATSSDAAR